MIVKTFLLLYSQQMWGFIPTHQAVLQWDLIGYPIIHFSWDCLPGVSIRFHQLKVHSHKSTNLPPPPPTAPLAASLKSGFWNKLEVPTFLLPFWPFARVAQRTQASYFLVLEHLLALMVKDMTKDAGEPLRGTHAQGGVWGRWLELLCLWGAPPLHAQ